MHSSQFGNDEIPIEADCCTLIGVIRPIGGFTWGNGAAPTPTREPAFDMEFRNPWDFCGIHRTFGLPSGHFFERSIEPCRDLSEFSLSEPWRRYPSRHSVS